MQDAFDVTVCVQRVKTGDLSAANALIDHLNPLVRRIVRNHLPRRGSEEDLMQEVFVKLLQKLEGVPMEQRTAYYVCAICCVFPDGEELTVRGECHGHIGFERDGNAGFGYDPLFLVEGRSFGRYTAEEKDKISHRGRALRTLAAELEKRI